MYLPDHFKVTDQDEIFAFIEVNSFAQVISTVDGRLFSSHIPLLVSADRSKLIGHFSKANPQWQELEGQEILVIFQGSHDYVSPSWYNSTGLPPTWNYQAVHIYGQSKTFHGSEKLKSIVESLTSKHESFLDKPWQPDYKEVMLRAIVGFEIDISEIQCKYKLSQNRTKQDQILVAEQLGNRGSVLLSQAMGNTNNDLTDD